MTDKPKVHASLTDLESEGKPEPFVYLTSKNKRVTFHDLFEMDWEEAEKFLFDMENKPNSEVLKEWLSAKDLAALKESKLSLRQMNILLHKVMAHYQGIVGDQGEGRASES